MHHAKHPSNTFHTTTPVKIHLSIIFYLFEELLISDIVDVNPLYELRDSVAHLYYGNVFIYIYIE